MKPARKHRPNWDDASYLMRTDPEREKKPRLVESEPLRIRSKRFNFETCRGAWLAIGLIQNEGHVRAHMARLKEWERRLRK
jgi:hypothetical protein